MKPLACSACKKRLDPNIDSVVYLGWGQRCDNRPGPNIVLAFCSTTMEQLDRGLTSPCVATALKLLLAAKITPIPTTFDQWQISASLNTLNHAEKQQLEPLLIRQEPEFT
ncbi:MAG: hypothetical protein AB1898_06960 [Acidobacteriota bacterium]